LRSKKLDPSDPFRTPLCYRPKKCLCALEFGFKIFAQQKFFTSQTTFGYIQYSIGIKMNQYSTTLESTAVPNSPAPHNSDTQYLLQLVIQLEEQIQRQSRRINRLESTLSEVRSTFRNNNVK
jgi:hypothetical protein